MNRPSVRVCFTPDLLKYFKSSGITNVVVVDILRATTSMCVALGHGAKAIIPVSSADEGLRMKNEGLQYKAANCQLPTANFLWAGEQDGIKLPYADLGNSPLEFKREIVEGKTIVFLTTNGTRAICESAAFGEVLIASFVNFFTILNFLTSDNKDVLIVCAGWKGQFSLEDTLFAGKLAEALINDGGFIAGDDSASASVSLWQRSSGNLLEVASKSSHYQRLLGIESEDGLRYCFEPAEEKNLPKMVGDRLVDWRIG